MQNFGPLMLDIDSTQLTQQEAELIANPQVGGVILFSRNFSSAEQLLALTQSIKQISDNCLIAVDQEGGRVQRFTGEFCQLPALKQLGDLYQADAKLAISYTMDFAELMAMEVLSVGCDLSLAPVLDLGGDLSQVIGDRGFSKDVQITCELASYYIQGMHKAGMPATGKHFPGHGSIVEDSHHSIAYDTREMSEIEKQDLKVFSSLITQLSAIMPAHVIYSQVDSQPAGFSPFWLKTVLRQQLDYDGVIFSDDLSMQGAAIAGDYAQRAAQALNAGCDMLLVCNNREGALQTLESLRDYHYPLACQQRLQKLQSKTQPIGLAAVQQSERWQYLNNQLTNFKKVNIN